MDWYCFTLKPSKEDQCIMSEARCCDNGLESLFLHISRVIMPGGYSRINILAKLDWSQKWKRVLPWVTRLSRHWPYIVYINKYSSETGLWETKKVRCIWSRLEYSVPLNGILHWLSSIRSNVDANYVVSFDFYNGDGDEFSTIPFPDAKQYEQRNHRFKRTITTSAGSVMYCNVNNGGCTIRVWRLVKYCNDDPIAAWKLSWELNTNSSLVGFGANYFPVVMHPLNSEIIYLWSRDKNGLVMLNLRTHKFSLHKDISEEEVEEENKSMDGCIMRLSGCKEYMDSIYSIYLNTHALYFSQFVLPRWLNPLPKLAS